MPDDPYDLDRFVAAQDLVYTQVRDELGEAARPATGCGSCSRRSPASGSARGRNAMRSRALDEARAYLAHPILGPRLRECVRLVLAVEGRSAHEIFGSPDDIKLHSCLTLFAEASDDAVFSLALQKYFGGELDRATMDRLR